MPPTDETGLTLGVLLEALGTAVVSLRVSPAGTDVRVRSATLLDADDLATAEPGDAVTDLCVLAGVPAGAAATWLRAIADQAPHLRPSVVVTKDVSAALGDIAQRSGVAVGALHTQARAEMVLSTVRSLLEGAAARVRPLPSAGTEAAGEESDLYGLAQRVAALTAGLVSIEDEQSRLLAYSATDGAADELRMLSILGREGPAEHLLRLRELGVYDRLRRAWSVIEVPADERLGWRRRLVVGIRPLDDGLFGDRSGPAHGSLGTIWLQEGYQPLDPDAAAVLEGAAAIAARLIHRARSAPTQEALQIQRLLGLRGAGVDVPSLASALAVPTTGPAVVVGITVDPGRRRDAPAVGTSELGAALRLLAGAYARESLVGVTPSRIYLLLPRARARDLQRWVSGVLDRLMTRFGTPLRAAIAAPVDDLGAVAAARAEVDRVLDRPAGVEPVTTLTQSRTPVLLGEIAELVAGRSELADPRLERLISYDEERDVALVATVEEYLTRFGEVRAAAAALHVHPNTLRYRIRRAEQILGMSLEEPDARLLLQIQLLARRHASITS